jgi:hypothetical protein
MGLEGDKRCLSRLESLLHLPFLCWPQSHSFFCAQQNRRVVGRVHMAGSRSPFSLAGKLLTRATPQARGGPPHCVV